MNDPIRRTNTPKRDASGEAATLDAPFRAIPHRSALARRTSQLKRMSSFPVVKPKCLTELYCFSVFFHVLQQNRTDYNGR